MRRYIQSLEEKEFDIVIIGGGIYGATAAWEAASRNLSVALIDRGDFACATSSNSHKIIHSGIRYLQHGDIKRVRESIQELCILMKIAPHLVHPLPYIMPTYGHGIKGPEAFRIALLFYKLIGMDIVRRISGRNKLPEGRVISRNECMELMPQIKTKSLSGAGIWYDGQIFNSERLLMSFLESADSKGACLSNYTEMTGFIESKGSVVGVRALDRLNGKDLEIRSKLVINAAGPWVDCVLKQYNPRSIKLNRNFCTALNLMTKKKIDSYGVAVMSHHEDDATLLNKGGRMYLIVPWQNASLIGTAQRYYDGEPDNFRVSMLEIETFLSEINDACPSLKLKVTDIYQSHSGLVPEALEQTGSCEVKVEKQYEIIDHEKRDDIKGLITVVGVKYTTARDVSRKIIDLASDKLSISVRPSITHYTPISGGDIGDLEEENHKFCQKQAYGLPDDVCTHLFYSYGTKVAIITEMIDKKRELAGRLSEHLPVIKAEVSYSLEYGMAMTIEDIVFRRTDLASMGNPGDDVLQYVGELAAEYHLWDSSKLNYEINKVKNRFELTN